LAILLHDSRPCLKVGYVSGGYRDDGGDIREKRLRFVIRENNSRRYGTSMSEATILLCTVRRAEVTLPPCENIACLLRAMLSGMMVISGYSI
jgi:hypothetical protein